MMEKEMNHYALAKYALGWEFGMKAKHRNKFTKKKKKGKKKK